MNEISALLRASSPLPSCEDTAREQLSRTREGGREGGHTRRGICWHLHLGLPASGTARNNCLSFKPRLWLFLFYQPKMTKTAHFWPDGTEEVSDSSLSCDCRIASQPQCSPQTLGVCCKGEKMQARFILSAVPQNLCQSDQFFPTFFSLQHQSCRHTGIQMSGACRVTPELLLHLLLL